MCGGKNDICYVPSISDPVFANKKNPANSASFPAFGGIIASPPFRFSLWLGQVFLTTFQDRAIFVGGGRKTECQDTKRCALWYKRTKEMSKSPSSYRLSVSSLAPQPQPRFLCLYTPGPRDSLLPPIPASPPLPPPSPGPPPEINGRGTKRNKLLTHMQVVDSAPTPVQALTFLRPNCGHELPL